MKRIEKLLIQASRGPPGARNSLAIWDDEWVCGGSTGGAEKNPATIGVFSVVRAAILRGAPKTTRTSG
jgi:hypothetical protein